MKFYYTLLALVISIAGYSQHTVTTILDSPSANVDDALALDSQGNLYGSNFGNFDGTTVYKITPEGETTAFITGLRSPNGLAFDSEENLFVVEYLGASIHKYGIDGNLIQTFQVGGYPSGLIKDFESDDMIFTNSLDSSLNRLSQNGTVTQIHQGSPLLYPVGLAYDKNGTLYIGNYVGREIYSLNSEEELNYVATVPDSGTDFPYLAFITYANGRILATVYGEHKIYKVHPNKIDDVEVYSGSVYGQNDGDISEATFAYPAGILANKSGSELYISEYSGLGNIRKITKGKKKNNIDLVPMNLKLSPNPTSEVLNLKAEIPNKGNINIKVYNIYGKMVFESNDELKNKNLSKDISVKGMPIGVYHVVVTSENGKETKRILVK